MSEFEQYMARYFAEKQFGMKATGTPTSNYTHGPGGLFGVAGISDPVVSGNITPRGIASRLSVSGSNFMYPLFPYITGYEETGTRTEPDGVCDDCISGVTQGCLQTAPFGEVCRQTKEIDMLRTQERVNRGEFDLNIVNNMLGFQKDPLMPKDLKGKFGLQVQFAWAMYEAGVFLQRKLLPLMWSGNPTNNSAGGGYKEFMGLDVLIGTNKIDAETGDSCDALDSDVKEFSYANINYAEADGSFRIVNYINAMADYLQHNASRMGLDPVKWVIAMRPEAWQELLRVWPLAYYSIRAGVNLPGDAQLKINAEDVVQLRSEMQRGMFLDTVVGRIEVVTDDGIFEHTNVNNGNVPAGSYASTFYFVPLTYAGRNKGTYLEYYDFTSTQPEIAAARAKSRYWITDGGKFIWTREEKKWCATISVKNRARVVLRVPQLAGKIENVLYTPVQHFRSYDQDSAYFAKGGVDSRTGPSLWSDWNTP